MYVGYQSFNSLKNQSLSENRAILCANTIVISGGAQVMEILMYFYSNATAEE